MEFIIDHFGKVIVVVVGIIAALCITAGVIQIVNNKTKTEVNDINYSIQVDEEPTTH